MSDKCLCGHSEHSHCAGSCCDCFCQGFAGLPPTKRDDTHRIRALEAEVARLRERCQYTEPMGLERLRRIEAAAWALAEPEERHGKHGEVLMWCRICDRPIGHGAWKSDALCECALRAAIEGSKT